MIGRDSTAYSARYARAPGELSSAALSRSAFVLEVSPNSCATADGAAAVRDLMPALRSTPSTCGKASLNKLFMSVMRNSRNAVRWITLLARAGSFSPASSTMRRQRPWICTTGSVVQIQGRCRLIVELAGEKDPARAKSVIQRTAFLEFRITDMKSLFKDALPQVDGVLRKAGIKSRTAAAPSAVAQLFGDTSKTKAERDSAADDNWPGVLSSLLFQGQMAGEYLVPEEQWPLVDSLINRPDVRAAMPRGIELRWGAQSESRGARAYRALYAVESRPIITGEELIKAVARRDQSTNQSIVAFQLSRRGARIFSQETARHIGDFMAIILEDRKSVV